MNESPVGRKSLVADDKDDSYQSVTVVGYDASTQRHLLRLSPDPQEPPLSPKLPFSVDLGASDVHLVPPCSAARMTPSQTTVTATTSTRHVPTLVQTDNNDQNNNDNNTFATAPRGKRSRNLADELSSPVLPRKIQTKFRTKQFLSRGSKEAYWMMPRNLHLMT